MNADEIRTFLGSFNTRQNRTIVIVDFGNVEKWKESLRWRVGIQELGRLIKNFSVGTVHLRRFYYGSDYGPSERSLTMTVWSSSLLERAKMNRFEVVAKRVKYMHDTSHPSGYQKKCDLDVEMAVDLIRLRDEYDNIVLFSGDGDLVCALRYLRDEYGKTAYVFGARGHIGREVMDAAREGVVTRLLFADDFEARLNMDRFRST